ncbi:MAG: tetratricopeptide repeat protein, partial [Candidatus Wallbacteria bacterium]|nr:tetratricopeptide repeat protein [Candidatus Wallbacteria bacterium]
ALIEEMLPSLEVSFKPEAVFLLGESALPDSPCRAVAYYSQALDAGLNPDRQQAVLLRIEKLDPQDQTLVCHNSIISLVNSLCSVEVSGDVRLLSHKWLYSSGQKNRALGLLKRDLVEGSITKECSSLISLWEAETTSESLDKRFRTASGLSPFYYLEVSQVWESVDPARALQNIEKFIASYTDPDDPEMMIPALFTASRLCEKLSRFQDAVDYLRRIVVGFHGFRKSAEAQKEIGRIAASGLKSARLLEDARSRFLRYYPELFNPKEWDALTLTKEVAALEPAKPKKERLTKEELEVHYADIRKLQEQEKEHAGTVEGAKLRYKIAEIHQKIEEHQKALDVLEQLTQDYPRQDWPEDLEIRMAELARDGVQDYAKSERFLRQYLMQYTDEKSSLNGLTLLADLLENYSMNYGKALETLDELSERFGLTSEGKETLIKKGDIYLDKLKDIDKALEMYQKFIEQNQENALAGEAELKIALVYENEYRDFEKARQQYQHIIDTYPQDTYRDRARDAINRLQDEGRI